MLVSSELLLSLGHKVLGDHFEPSLHEFVLENEVHWDQAHDVLEPDHFLFDAEVDLEPDCQEAKREKEVVDQSDDKVDRFLELKVLSEFLPDNRVNVVNDRMTQLLLDKRKLLEGLGAQELCDVVRGSLAIEECLGESGSS